MMRLHNHSSENPYPHLTKLYLPAGTDLASWLVKRFPRGSWQLETRWEHFYRVNMLRWAGRDFVSTPYFFFFFSNCYSPPSFASPRFLFPVLLEPIQLFSCDLASLSQSTNSVLYRQNSTVCEYTLPLHGHNLFKCGRRALPSPI